MDKKNTAPVGVGVTSIFTVLLALTLSVFSALTLSSARADLALSRINADTIAAYYAADSEAVRLCREFADSGEPEFTAQIPVNDDQILDIHLLRENGEVHVLRWQVMPLDTGDELFEDTLPVWGGELP